MEVKETLEQSYILDKMAEACPMELFWCIGIQENKWITESDILESSIFGSWTAPQQARKWFL